ncbi:hypothetical protein DTO271D3_7049 [Paecilomyces variotii]|nr:hypothetical protein DTO271D3_7049 [Paecilomyces variotii]KAJ9353927.1 hypothetical protein DTO280E4_7082 [Paecilomyces variotii]
MEIRNHSYTRQVMSHSASRTWVSAETKEYEAFVKLCENVFYVAPYSPFVPRSWPDWIAHRLTVKEEARKEIVKRLAAREAQRKTGNKRKVEPLLGGKDFDDYLTRVLSRESIWIPSIAERPDRPQAPWPCQDELQHEGSHRNKSGFSRFAPLPRVPGNATVNWKQRAQVKQFSFDEIGLPVTTKEEQLEIDEELLMLIGYALMKELDN